jgi:DNA-directed RNA polymerase specialized sigma24 family protein
VERSQLSPLDEQFDVSEPGEHTNKRKWRLTKEAFDTLLVHLSPDRDEAGRFYQTLHRKLVRYFEWRGVEFSEDRSDETINRVARRLEEGQVIDNLPAYIYGVARKVVNEALKEQSKKEPLEGLPPKIIDDTGSRSESDPKLVCFDSCIGGLAIESRMLILGYYQEERRKKIQLRQELASNLRIPLNALRIRAHRIRVNLEDCIRKCLQTNPNEMNLTPKH